MNESRRNGANRLVMADLDLFWGEASAPLRIPGVRYCSTKGCHHRINSYNQEGLCPLHRSKQLSRELERSAMQQVRIDKTHHLLTMAKPQNKFAWDRVCKEESCGKTFHTDRRTKQYCSPECQLVGKYKRQNARQSAIRLAQEAR